MEDVLPQTVHKEPEFTSLPIRKKSLASEGMNRYRIYKADGETVTVEGRNASEAFQASGVERARKIVRESTLQADILIHGALGADVGVVSTLVDTVKITGKTTWIKAPRERGAKSVADLQKAFERISLLVVAEQQAEAKAEANRAAEPVAQHQPAPVSMTGISSPHAPVEPAVQRPAPAQPVAAAPASAAPTPAAEPVVERELTEDEVQALLREGE